MSQEEKLEEAKRLYKTANADQKYVLESLFPELMESEDERIRKEILDYISKATGCKKWIAWLEKQGETNPYNGVSFEYNGHTWGMCARDNGVDISCDKHIIGHLKKQGEQKSTEVRTTGYWHVEDVEQNPSWSEEDENYYNETIAIIDSWIKNKENDRFRYKDAELGKQSIDWLKFLKERNTWKPSDEQMNALEYYMHTLVCNEHKEILFGLYADLKKLKG